MVKLCSAGSRVQDSWSVLLENSCISFNGDWNWLFSNCSLELSSRVCWDGSISADFNLSLILWSFASLGQSGINVILFKILWIFFGIYECVGLPTTLASIWRSVAINELLFGQGKEGSSSNEMLTFNCSGGWEGPAWSALGLVFDSVDCTFSSPVYGIGKVWFIEVCWLLNFTGWWHLESVQSLGFVFCHCGEHVVSDCEWILAGVDFIDFSIFLLIDVESELILFLGSITESEFLHVFDEVLFKKSERFLLVVASVVMVSSESSGFAE